MSSKNISANINSNSRIYGYNSKKKKSRNKKAIYYPKNKTYKEEIDFLTSNSIKDNDQEKININCPKNNCDIDIMYEDEYQGLIYNRIYPDTNSNAIYYYFETIRKDDFNNFRTKWKTEMCKYWEMYGKCKFGDNCAFAHGDSELKQRKLTFNYKTKPCKQFFELGYCSYGCRCQFSHKKEDFKKEIGSINDEEVSYLKIIKEFLSDDNQISLELVKRPRLMTFEKITSSTVEESENSKLQLYEDIINIKKNNSNKNNNLKFKLSVDSNHTNDVSSDTNNNDKEKL